MHGVRSAYKLMLKGYWNWQVKKNIELVLELKEIRVRLLYLEAAVVEVDELIVFTETSIVNAKRELMKLTNAVRVV